MTSRHRAWAGIHLNAFRKNLQLIQKLVGEAEVWPVLKANAYGHGARQMAKICQELCAARLGVGDSGEALELREAGIETPLLVLGTAIDSEIPDLLEHDIEVGLHSESRALTLAEMARKSGKPLGVHLKVDTGMTRLGVLPEAALRVARAVVAEPFLELRGLMTHHASPNGLRSTTTREQETQFKNTVAELQDAQVPIPCIHSANSAAIFTGSPPFGNAVRPGIALYGVLPLSLDTDLRLEPVLSLHAQVVFLKDVPASASVGYGGLWKSPRPTRLAVLPIGYNDGLPYRLGAQGRGWALVQGVRCPIVGAVSMDYCTIDVGHVPGVDIGDTATLLGKDGEESLTIQELADAAGTIPYEITCSLGSRVQRIYSDSETQAPKLSLSE